MIQHSRRSKVSVEDMTIAVVDTNDIKETFQIQIRPENHKNIQKKCNESCKNLHHTDFQVDENQPQTTMQAIELRTEQKNQYRDTSSQEYIEKQPKGEKAWIRIGSVDETEECWLPVEQTES